MNISPRNMVILSGSSHPKITDQIVQRLGKKVGTIKLGKFSNLETSVEIGENVREKDVFVMQTACGKVNDNFMELLIIIHACKIASARRITAVIPCFPYARQTQNWQGNSRSRGENYDSWHARPGTLICNLLMTAGVSHVVTMDLHDPQLSGFFDIPVDNLSAQPLMLKYIRDNFPFEDALIVSPDSGGAKRASAVAKDLGCDFGLVHRAKKKDQDFIFVGNVEGKIAIIVDDIVDTGGTLCHAANVLAKNGAKKIFAIVTHGILSQGSVAKIEESPIEQLVVSTTVPQDHHHCDKIKSFDVGGLFAEAVRRIHNNESISFLFEHVPTHLK
eukprot:Lithocolla_globosa_v1_NODE_4572_length_1408_cov_10.325203.p1 type:complete len:331 gc:universal NODE_4572_length_1408_cov_10.325203:375-1367(+)